MNYQRFLTILYKWPVNSSKKSRDYGYFLRQLVQNKESDGDIFPGASVDVPKKLDSISRMADNIYGKKYSYSLKVGASGLDRTHLPQVLTDEFVEYFNKNQGFLSKIFQKKN